ncbi:MAG TPA: glycosyltransferase [Tepidisphaeraceae bacterium]|jgi:glycosyltransferase involved in cell wall biosynthesis
MSVAISVIMSVYNGEKYLAEAVDSVLNQTFKDFEFIVIDDGSKDGSVAMMEQYAKRDSRIAFKTHANKGLTATLNDCLKTARGPLIARMDPDDVSLPTRFEKQVAFLNEHPDVVNVGSRVILIDPFGTPYQTTDHPLTHDELDRDLLRGLGWAIVHPVAMMRKSTLDQLGGYNEKYRTSQDMELWLRMAEVGKLANIAEPLLHYRQHLESANFAKAEQQKKFKSQILAEAYARRGLPPFDPAILPKPPMTDPFESRKRWGWAALKHKNKIAARSHAWTNLKTRPTSIEMWKLLFCSVRGY